MIAGVWRRLGAFLIDTIVLGVAGAAAGFLLFDVFARLGTWGRLLGFAIALAYFGLLNSRLGHGQTLGKRLLKIKVVGADGAALPIPKSLLRFTVLGTPWFLNGAPFPMEILFSPMMYVLSLAIFGLGLAIIYLFFFNRSSRQSLHDLAAGSYVVRSESNAPIVAVPLWRAHLNVVGVIFVAATVVPFFTSRLHANETFAGLFQVVLAVNAEPEVAHATVNKSWPLSAEGKSTYLQVMANLLEPRITDEELAKSLAKVSLDADPSAMKLDVVQVVLIYGYDIGIASANRSQSYVRAPADWLRTGP